jgi:hypothetical protein
LRQITGVFAPETHFIEVGLVPQEQRKHKSIALTVVGRRLVAQPRALADQNDEEFSYNLNEDLIGISEDAVHSS